MNTKMFFLPIVSFLIIGCAENRTSEINYVYNPVTKPQIFAPGIVSTTENSEFDLCFTPDGKTIYFTRRIPDTKQKIYSTQFEGGKWSNPEIAPFSTDRDETPFITPDGNTFYFGSEREIPGSPNKGGFDMNIWMMKRGGNSWSRPKPLPEPINTVQIEGEEWPSSNSNFLFTPDGKKHYFSTMVRGSNSIDIFTTDLTNGTFSPPKKIEGLFEKPELWKSSGIVSPDGKFLIFNTYDAPGGSGGEDIYVSKRTPQGWSKAISIGDMINTSGEETNGRFSPDGKYFFYTHADNLGNYEYSPWSIYFIETVYLDLESKFK